MKKENSTALSWLIFLVTLEIVLISLITVVFPALIARTVSPVAISPIDPLEIGAYAMPLILSNVIIFGIAILFKINKLPQILKKSIEFVFNFEVSKKIAVISIIVLLVIYVAATVNELSSEEAFGDYTRVKQRVSNWNINQIDQLSEPHFRYFLLSSSLSLFDNIRIIPFIASIALLVLTYLITYEITKKRFAGLAAFVILLQSPVFLKYDTTATYEKFLDVTLSILIILHLQIFTSITYSLYSVNLF